MGGVGDGQVGGMYLKWIYCTVDSVGGPDMDNGNGSWR